jgi:hypothetical protein
LFFVFFLQTTKEKKRKETNKERVLSGEQTTPKHLAGEARSPPSAPGRRRPKREMLGVAFRKDRALVTPTTSSLEEKGFHPQQR